MEEKASNSRAHSRTNTERDSVALGVAFRPARFIAVLVACTLGLSLLSLIANVMWAQQSRGAETAIHLFSVDKEGSLPTWWSALLLAALGGLTWLVAHNRKSKSWGECVAWWALAAGFLFLSIDESCSLHERIGRMVQLEGSMHHARWILLWLPPAILAAAAILWRLWRSSKRMVIGMSLGIAVFLSGAVGMESLNAKYRYHAETQARQEVIAAHGPDTELAPRDWRIGSSFYPYILGTALEELLEILGPVIWFGVLLTLYREQLQPKNAPAQSPAVPPDSKALHAIA